MNEVDAIRPIEQVRRLYALSKQLGFADDTAHWRQVLVERGEEVSL